MLLPVELFGIVKQFNYGVLEFHKRQKKNPACSAY
jgi:hypothetical protein